MKNTPGEKTPNRSGGSSAGKNAGFCATPGCEQSAVSSLGGEAYCRSHFIDTCYVRLEQFEELRNAHSVSVTEAESMRRFIHECSRQADEIEHKSNDLDNLERAKLLHIILSASEVGRFLRRSPRKAASIPVHISCQKLGGFWEEDSKTVLLSRYGASVQCSHTAKPGECLQIERFDTGQKAQARVAWQRPSENESVRIGVEFLNCDNFWGLDWAAVEDTR
ncbi:MAG: PilZ domain-containing protein [Candidatus Acidiferrales bacterium]